MSIITGGANYSCLDRRAYSYNLQNAPSTLPISLTQVKEHLRLDVSDSSDDSYLTSLIYSVTKFVEHYTKRDILTKQYLTYRDEFYAPITIRKCQVKAIDSFKYLVNDVFTLFDSSNYYFTNNNDYFSQILLKKGKSYPSVVENRLQSIEILFRAGYGMQISTMARASNVVTVVMAKDHYYTTDDYIVIAGATPSTFNGTQKITVTNSTTFTFNQTGADESATVSVITTANKIPYDLILGMLHHIARMYANRGDCAAGNIAACSVSSGVNLPPETINIYNMYKIIDIVV